MSKNKRPESPLTYPITSSQGIVATVLPWVVLGMATLFLMIVMVRAGVPDNKPDFDAFGRLPVLDKGRVKPMDTLARTSMMLISSREVWSEGLDEKHQEKPRRPAVEWLLNVLTWDEPPKELLPKLSFHIENPALQALLKLPPREGSVYGYLEILPAKELLDRRRDALEAVKEEDLTDDDRAVMALTRQIGLTLVLVSNRSVNAPVFRVENDQLLKGMGLPMQPGFYRYSMAELAPHLAFIEGLAQKAKDKEEHQRELLDAKALELWRKIELYAGLVVQQGSPLMIPPARDGMPWMTYTQGVRLAQSGHATSTVKSFHGILEAWRDGKPEEFNKKVEDYRKWLGDKLPVEMERSDFETFINHFSPFFWCSVLYVLVGVFSCIGWLGWERPMNRTAFWLMVLTLCIHTWALFVRMYLMGRPLVFVTNLYSSAIFIGWGCVVLGVILEAIYKNGLGNLIGSVSGYITLVIAANLAMDGDTLEMMRAVLDTNFWLATHVTTVTLGYTATFVAGGLGLFFIFRGLLTTLSQEEIKRRSEMIYGVICFATLLSFVGTVLGGIWADQSWGRFWGWDPKENGALLIVIWNALVLHARWGGMIKQRGVAVLAVLGNIVTAWSWFGTNMLGVGLHSYGFMAGAFNWLMLFAFSQMAVAGIGCIPLAYWRSFAKPAQPPDVLPVREGESVGMPTAR